MGCLLVGCFKFLVARKLYRSLGQLNTLVLFNRPQFLTANKPSEFPPTLTSTIEQTDDDGRLFTGPNAQNWLSAQDVTKTEMSERVHWVHVHKLPCSISSLPILKQPWLQFRDTLSIHGYFEVILNIQYWHMSSRICYNYEAQIRFVSGNFYLGRNTM